MHVPDGFLNLPTSAGTALVAAAAVGACLRAARRDLNDRTAPLAGLVASFVFAAQMVNFPVGAGTSGHLIGGVLAAVLVGPATATLCLTVVVVVQALVFADGGLTALGTNILLLAVVAVWVGWGVFRSASTLMRQHAERRMPVLAGIAAFVSVPAAATVFSALFLVGGAVPVAPGTLFGSMVGVHLLIGLGEGVITALVVAAVARVRPDLVYALRMLTQRPNVAVG